MKDTTDPLAELKTALGALSPHDLAVWTEGVESRLTERFRRRQESGHIPHPDGIPEPPGFTTDEEDNNARYAGAPDGAPREPAPD